MPGHLLYFFIQLPRYVSDKPFGIKDKGAVDDKYRRKREQ
jgi:hypothetical protein